MAAEEAGIPIEEAIEWLVRKETAAAQDEAALRLLSAEALEAGVRTLQELAAGGARIASEGSEGGGHTSTRPDDLVAAKALVDLGLKLRRQVGKKETADGSSRDLFDAPPSNWTFTKR